MLKVVPDESSSLDSREYGNDTIHANHMGMCRFEDADDDGYEKFKGALTKFLVEIKSEQGNANKTSLDVDGTRRSGQSLSGIWFYSLGLSCCENADCRHI